MRPTLFSIGPLDFHSYTVFMALAFLVGVLCSVRENYKREDPFPVTPIIGIWIFIGAILGSKAYWIIQYDTWRHLYRVFLWDSGLVFFGGLLGGGLAGILYLRWRRVPLAPAADIAMPYVALAHGIARIGCFLNGCCWGSPTDVPWAVCYPRTTWPFIKQAEAGLIAKVAEHANPVHPTQLYATVGLLTIFFVLRIVYKRPHPTGLVALLYFLLYGVLRFVLEWFRGDSQRPLMGLTVSQAIAALLVVGSLVLLVVLWLGVWRKQAAARPEERPDVQCDIH